MPRTRFYLIDGNLLFRTMVLPDGGLQGEVFNVHTGAFELHMGYVAAAEGFSDLECEELTELAFQWYLKKRQATAARDSEGLPQQVPQVTTPDRRRSGLDLPVINTETLHQFTLALLQFLHHPLNLKRGLLSKDDEQGVILHLPATTATVRWSPAASVADTYVFMAVLRSRLWDTLHQEGFVESYGYGQRCWIQWGETQRSHDGNEYASILHTLKLQDVLGLEVLELLRCINASRWWSDPPSEEEQPS